MSATYTDLISPFPNAIDLYILFTDVNATNKPYVDLYYTKFNANDFAGATQVLTDHPELKYVIINANTLQKIYDSLIAVERFITDTAFYEKLGGIVKDMGDYNGVTPYSLFNIVYYNSLAYMMTGSNGVPAPAGTLPTNTTYWKPLTIRGLSGTGMTFYPSWTSGQNFVSADCVPYGNKLYVSLRANTNKIPSSSPDDWASIITVPKQIISAMTQPEGQDTNDIWHKTNSTDSSYEEYVKQSDGTYLRQYPVSNASFITCTDGSKVEDGVIHIYTCTTTGTVHKLVGTGSNGKFLADANFVGGDTFTVGTTSGNAIAKTATTQNGAVLDDSYFVSGKWVNFTYDGTNLNFKSGGGTAVEIFNFKLFIQSAQPTAEKAGDLWVNHALATDFNNIVLDDAVKVSYTNGSLMLIVDDTNNGQDNITQTKNCSGTKIPFTSHRNTVNDTTLPWQAGTLNKSGNIIDIKRKYPIVYSRLSDVLNLETASVWDGTQWVLISQQGSYLALGTNSSSTPNFLYNRIGESLSLHSGIVGFPSAAVNCINDSHDGINLIYGLTESPWAIEVKRTGDTPFIDAFVPHTSETVTDAFYTYSREKLFLVHTHHVDIYDTTSGMPVYLSTLPLSTSNSYYGGDVSPDDSEFIITGSATPFIWRFKLSTLAQLANPTTLPTGACYKCKYDPTGKFPATRTVSSPYVICYHIISDIQWDKISNPSILPSGSSYAEGIVFTPNSGYLIIADYTASKIWFYTYSISGLVNVTSFSCASVASIGISSDGTKIGVGLISSPWFAWYSLAGTTLMPLTNPTAMPTSRVNSLDFLN